MGTATDDTLERLKALSDRLDRLRKQAREVQNLASDQIRTVHMNSLHRDMPNFTERRAVRRT
jgi:hypothetical protein